MSTHDPASVTCIIPVYNGERYLTAALESVHAQDAPPKILVVDDGSTDGTGAVLDRFAGRVQVHRQENGGPGAARNAGIRVATTPLLAFLDADDLWLGDKLRQQLAVLAARPELGFVLTHIENFWEEELGPVPDAVLRSPASLPRPGFYFQTMLAHRQVFDAVGPLDESLRTGEDLDWFMRAFEREIPFEILPAVLVKRRIHGANLTGLGGGDSSRQLDLLRGSLQRRRASAGSAETVPGRGQ